MQYAQDGWVSTPDAQITTFMVNDMAAMMYSGTHMFSQILAADPDLKSAGLQCPALTENPSGWRRRRGRTGDIRRGGQGSQQKSGGGGVYPFLLPAGKL